MSFIKLLETELHKLNMTSEQKASLDKYTAEYGAELEEGHSEPVISMAGSKFKILESGKLEEVVEG